MIMEQVRLGLIVQNTNNIVRFCDINIFFQKQEFNQIAYDILGKSLLLKEVCIREVEVLEKQWNETLDSKSKIQEDEFDMNKGM